MTKEQKQYKLLIKAVEKTIKFKAGLAGLNLWGHDIDVLIRKCDDNGVDINVPKLIRDKADAITHWEADCRYYPVTVVRRDTIKKVYDETVKWLEL